MKKTLIHKFYGIVIMSLCVSASALALDSVSTTVKLGSGTLFNGGSTVAGGTSASSASSSASSAERKAAIVLGARYATPENYNSAVFKSAKNAVADTLGKAPSELGSDDEAAQLIRNMAELIQAE